MEGDVQKARKAAAVVGREIKKEGGKAKMEKMAVDLMKKGAVPKDLLGIGDAMVEGIYSQAYRLYNTGKYRDAAQLFRLLVMLNVTEAKYCMGLAACFHMLKEYPGALNGYVSCSMIDPESPLPHFHASDCHLHMNNPIGALVALEMAVKRAGDKPQYATLRDRALLTIEGLRKQITEKQQKG